MMKNIVGLFCFIASVSILASCVNGGLDLDDTKYVMVIHGGAGTIERQHMTLEKEAAYVAALTEALQRGLIC